jgi:hypothetical protein
MELQSSSRVGLYVLCEVGYSVGVSFGSRLLIRSSILPALAFSLDMFAKTHSTYGVNEVLLSSVLAAVVFSLFAAQPLTIVGVTGPITVFNYTVFDIMASRTNYLSFMSWIGMYGFS